MFNLENLVIMALVFYNKGKWWNKICSTKSVRQDFALIKSFQALTEKCYSSNHKQLFPFLPWRFHVLSKWPFCNIAKVFLFCFVLYNFCRQRNPSNHKQLSSVSSLKMLSLPLTLTLANRKELRKLYAAF